MSSSSASASTAELKQLEQLFVDKLTEKYRLTERDIKRAFCKFDTDNSGYLNIDELTTAIHQVIEMLHLPFNFDGSFSP
jgi:Ca2+-binding EF-hand superfamily protein